GATFNDEAGEQVLSYLQALAKDGRMPGADATVQPFAPGQLGMLVDPSVQRVNTPRQGNAEVRLAPVPVRAGRETRLAAGGPGVLMFSRDPAKQEAAWRFLEFLAGPEAGRIVAENTGYTPGNAALLETLAQENASDPDYVLVLQQVANVVPWHAWPSNNGT